MEIQEIKVEFDLNDRIRCRTCLCVGRQLLAVGEYAEIYRKFACNTESYDIEYLKEVLVCWECQALLKKIARFQRRVLLANATLQCNTASIYSSLSSLTCVKINNDTDTNTIYIDVDNHSETLVKKETEDFNEADCKESSIVEDYEDISNDAVNENYSTYERTLHSDANTEIIDVKKSKLPKQLNRWARKRVLQNKKPKFRILSNNEVDKIFRIEKIDYSELDIYLQCRRSSESYKCKEYKCETCVIGFKTKKSLSKHNSKLHNQNTGSYSCDICAAILKSKRHLAAHVKNHYIKYLCAVCGHVAWSARERDDHAYSHGKVFQCLKCDLMFGSRRDFYSHFKEWHERFVCDLCGVSFKMRYCIKQHIRKQHSVLECLPCNKRFARYNGLWLHNKTHHTAPSGGGYCVECDKHYPDIYRYRWHLANSTRHKPRKKARIPCPGCDKVFSKNIYMKDHYDLVHLKRYKYRCEDCDKNFIRNADLVKHRRRVHEGIQPPRNKVCHLCGRGFTTNKILSNHVRTHTGERPFLCALCPARFAQSAALAGHTRNIHATNT